MLERSGLAKEAVQAVHPLKANLCSQGKGKDAPALRNLCMELRKVCNHPLLCDGVEQEIQERWVFVATHP